MSIVTLDKDGNRVTLRKGQSLEEKVKEIKVGIVAKGEAVSPCIKNILQTKQDEGEK